MKNLFLFLLMCICTFSSAQITEVRINELDADQPGSTGSDTLEFVELYGEPGLALDGLVLVFFNGNSADNVVYDVYDLAGYTLDEGGFFVLGSPGVDNVDAFLGSSSDAIQNGPDAIGLYTGTAADWVIGTPASSINLLDAVVYGTNDSADADLLAIMTPGQSQLNDIPGTTTSLSRVPDGGLPSDLSSYNSQSPTPGFSNNPECSGAQIILNAGALEQCTDSTYQPLSLANDSEYGDNYIYVVTDTFNVIIETFTSGLIDLNTFGPGILRIWGASYNGTINAGALDAGAIIDNAGASDCFSVSVNSITVTRTDCFVSACDAGIVTLEDGLAYISYCEENTPGLLTFTHTPTGGNSQYRYFLTNADDLIYQEISGSSFNVDNLPIGEYHLYGVSYFGNLVPQTIQPGDPVAGIQADGECAVISENYIDIRNLDCIPEPGCTRLMISEYIDGTGANNAIELYNPTPFPVTLDDYDLFARTMTYINSEVVFDTIVLSTPIGTLDPGETFVICSALADQEWLDLADTTQASMATFDGNDAIMLTYNLETIDVIGEPTDTVEEWTFGLASTRLQTLRRKFEATAPTTNWELSAGQWDVFEVNDISGLGFHEAQVCSQQPYLSFSQTAIQINEGNVSFAIQVNAFNILDPTNVQVVMTQGTATEGEDFSNTFPIQYEFTPDNTMWNILINILEDDIEEEIETFTLTIIAEPQADAILINEFISVSIIDNDQSYPFYPIATITSQNGLGVLDSLNTYCSIGGVVHGINFNPGGLEFTLIDPTDGIKVFSPSDNLGYEPTEGDSLVIFGRVDQFQGMALFFPDSLFLIAGGYPLEVAEPVSTLGEENESHMVIFSCVTLVDPSEWNPTGNGFDVEITDGVNTNVMRIDLNTDIYNSPAPQGHFTVVGIGAQSDLASPFNLGYKFFPRYLEDFSDEVIASFTMPASIDYGDNGATIAFENTGSTGTYAWDFGDDSTSNEASPEHFYSYAFLSGTPSVTISLSTTIDGCTDVVSQTVDANFLSIDPIQQPEVTIYPNPAYDILTIQSSQPLDGWVIFDCAGREVLRNTLAVGGAMVIDVSGLPAGVYGLQYRMKENFTTSRFVKK